jgi:hypothetical protein
LYFGIFIGSGLTAQAYEDIQTDSAWRSYLGKIVQRQKSAEITVIWMPLPSISAPAPINVPTPFPTIDQSVQTSRTRSIRPTDTLRRIFSRRSTHSDVGVGSSQYYEL